MSGTSKELLSELSLRLRNSNPEAWVQFVDVFDAYATEVTVAVISAPQQDILSLQGRAQQMLALLRLFKECDLPKKATPPAPAPQ